mmetsp:Transcript_7252/g.12242  ORF Transcript_7252/g.12242 Transcript_7252/m.12242 type:complete len:209 (-) Transcript_7252:56-682(-)
MRSTFGFHSVLQKVDHPSRKSAYVFTTKEDTVILRLSCETIEKLRYRSKELNVILKEQAKIMPECDFTAFITYQPKLTSEHIRFKFMRALRRLIQINKRKSSVNRMIRASIKNAGIMDKKKDGEMIEEDDEKGGIRLSNKAQRNLEQRIFGLLKNAEILEDIEVIVAQNQIQKRKLVGMVDHMEMKLQKFREKYKITFPDNDVFDEAN